MYSTAMAVKRFFETKVIAVQDEDEHEEFSTQTQRAGVQSAYVKGLKSRQLLSNHASTSNATFQFRRECKTALAN